MTTTTTRRTTGERPAPADGNVLDERQGFPGRGRWLTLGLLVSAQFVVMLDTSIVNVALPSIQADLGLGAADATWIVNAYVVAFGGLLLLSGRLADLFGRRGMFTAGSALFTVGTLLAAVAADQGLLLAGRVVQGVGAAALSPAAMSLLMLAFPGQARARAMSIWGAASTLGGATGVVLGGLLAGSLGWRSVFLVTVPISVVAVALARHVLPDERSRTAAPVRLGRCRFHHRSGRRPGARRPVRGRPGLDGPTRGREPCCRRSADGGLRDVERRVADPLVPLSSSGPGHSRSGSPSPSSAAPPARPRSCWWPSTSSRPSPWPRNRRGWRWSPRHSPGSPSPWVLPWMLRTLGPRRSLVIGLVVLAAGHLWLAYAPTGSGYLVAVLPGLLLVATGVALGFMPTTMVIASGVPDAHAGLAAGLAGSATPGRRRTQHGHVHRSRPRVRDAVSPAARPPRAL